MKINRRFSYWYRLQFVGEGLKKIDKTSSNIKKVREK